MAVLVRNALAAEDLTAFAELLDPPVTWGAPGARNPTCKNRNQVMAWYQRGRMPATLLSLVNPIFWGIGEENSGQNIDESLE